MMIPDRDPREPLVREEQVKIGAVSSKTTSIIVECEDLALRLDGTGGGRGRVLVDVIAELDWDLGVRHYIEEHSILEGWLT